jgi:hypothetical protein
MSRLESSIAVIQHSGGVHMLKTVFASVIAAAATIALSVGAAAAFDGTVQHLSLNIPQQCFPGKGGGTHCVASTGEETIVQTTSGNFIGEVNLADSFVVNYNGAVIASGTDSIHEHVLYASNFAILKEGGVHQNSIVTSDGVTCTIDGDLHVTDLDFAAGTAHVEYSNFSIVCV